MKKFIRAAMSVLLVICCTFLVSCSGTKFDSAQAKIDINAYLATLSQEYRDNLMLSMIKLQNDENSTYTIDYDANHDTSNGTFKVGMECAYAPYNWTQNDDSNGAVPIENVDGKYANGYDVQIAAKVACALGMKLEIYQYEWDSLIPAVQAGTLHAIIAGMSPTAERMEVINFTNPYYSANLVVVTKEGSENITNITGYTTLAELDQAGIKIGAQSGTFHADALKDQTNNLTVDDTYSDFETMRTALEMGTIDGYIAEEPTAKAYLGAACQGGGTLTYIALVNNVTGFTATDADVSIAIGLKK